MKRAFIKYLYLFIPAVILLPLGILALAYDILNMAGFSIEVIDIIGGFIANLMIGLIGMPFVGGVILTIIGGILLKMGWD